MTDRLLICGPGGPGREALSAPLAAQGHAVVAAESLEEARAELLRGELTTVLVDLQEIPGPLALGFLREVRRLQPGADVLVMTSYASVETAVTALQQGASDYLTKPFGFAELEARLTRLRKVREQREELDRLRVILDESGASGGLCLDSPSMRAVGERIQLFANAAVPVLLIGEVGTGKELAARTIHSLGSRRAQPFVLVPCAEHHDVTAALQAADRGTALLDDVGALSAAQQVDLVRLVRKGTLPNALGGEQPIDVRIVASTEVDLAVAAHEGRFRRDLLDLFEPNAIRLPPLRQRGDDVLLVAGQFLRVLASKEGRQPRSLSTAAAELLRRHAWPGNIGELQRVIASAFTFARTPEIEPADLPESLRSDPEPDRPFTLHLEGQPHLCLQELVRQFERELVEWALQKAGGKQARAAEILGVPAATVASKRNA